MCEHCDEEVDRLRTVVDTIVQSEALIRPLLAPRSPAEHTVRLANAILLAHRDNQGYMGSDDVRAMALEYALMVQRLLALQEMAGVSPP